MDRIRAARPDYTRKPRNTNRKKASGAKKGDPGEGKDDTVAGNKPSQAPDEVAVTAEGDILVGSGDDGRRWWEKW